MKSNYRNNAEVNAWTVLFDGESHRRFLTALPLGLPVQPVCQRKLSSSIGLDPFGE
jgi:hypothetical protein